MWICTYIYTLDVPCLIRGIRPDDLQRSLPTAATLQFLIEFWRISETPVDGWRWLTKPYIKFGQGRVRFYIGVMEAHRLPSSKHITGPERDLHCWPCASAQPQSVTLTSSYPGLSQRAYPRQDSMVPLSTSPESRWQLGIGVSEHRHYSETTNTMIPSEEKLWNKQ